MHRTDADGNVAGAFTDGNPAIPQVATLVDAAWLNDIQENVCTVIESAGITLVKGTGTQLRDAIRNPPAWVAMTVLSPWIALSHTPSYRFEVDSKRVFLKGSLSATIGSGADWDFWNLPVGYRPPFEIYVPGTAHDGSIYQPCTFHVGLGGTPYMELVSVHSAAPVNGTSYTLFLDGVSWTID
jgi:hypothetical protein